MMDKAITAFAVCIILPLLVFGSVYALGTVFEGYVQIQQGTTR